MTVEVDRDSIAKAWRKAGGGEFYFEFRPTGQPADKTDNDPLTGAGEVADWVNEEAVSRYGLDDAPFVEGVSDSDRGVSALMNPAGADLEVRTWFDLFAQQLTERGWSGDVRAARVTWAPGWSTDREEVGRAIGAFLRFTPHESPSHDTNQPGLDLSEENLAALAGVVDEWNATRTAARTYLIRGDFSGPAPTRNLGTALTKAALRNGLSSVMWVDRRTRTTACVSATSGAQAYFSVASATEGWRDRLQTVTGALVRFGPHLEVGMIRITKPIGNSWRAVRGIPPEPPGDIAATDDLWLAREYVLDVYGTQVLTGTHLERTRDLSSWNITELGNDRHLVSHPDPEAWYAHDTPNSAILARARQDFGDLIITDEKYRALKTEDLAHRQQT